MNEHLQDLKSGGRPMTKLELANKEIERLKKELEGKEAILGGIQQLEAEIERLEKENERYRIAINEMAIIISKAIEYIEKYSNDDFLGVPNWRLLEILKGSDKE